MKWFFFYHDLTVIFFHGCFSLFVEFLLIFFMQSADRNEQKAIPFHLSYSFWRTTIWLVDQAVFKDDSLVTCWWDCVFPLEVAIKYNYITITSNLNDERSFYIFYV